MCGGIRSVYNGLKVPTTNASEEKLRIKALIALFGRLSLRDDWRNGPERGQNCFIQPLTSCNSSKHCRPWSDATFCSIWSGSALFANVPNVPVQVLQITLYQQHSDITVTRIAWLLITITFFCLKRGLITLANDNHVDNYLLVTTFKQSTQNIYLDTLPIYSCVVHHFIHIITDLFQVISIIIINILNKIQNYKILKVSETYHFVKHRPSSQSIVSLKIILFIFNII